MASFLEQAREAAQLGSWAEAEALYERVAPSKLEAADLESMADGAWWRCHIDDSIAARQKAYAAYLEAGEPRRAAYAAWFLSLEYGIKGELSVRSGWLKRAQRHLADDPECAERGFLAITEADLAIVSGDLAEARTRAELAVELGERCDSLDLQAMGIQTLGRVMVASGDHREGMALLDEAMTLVIGQRLSPLFTGLIYCSVLAACMERADLGRAGEWTEAAMTWCQSISEVTPYHGICRIHRAEITALRGDWDRAESEALSTVQEMHGLEQDVVAEAHYAIGNIHLRRGELRDAEGWFTSARDLGRDPQPGLALVGVAEGKLAAAAAGLRLSAASAAEPTLQRARLLAAQAEVALALNEVDAARQAVEDLGRVASETPSALLDAIEAMARARLHLAEAQIDHALQFATRAWSLWNKLKIPYDAARARMFIGLVSRLAGDPERARSELEAARAEFYRLGAKLDARAAEQHLEGATDLPRRLSLRELEVLRLVAVGKTNREIAEALTISEHTVSRHLQNIFGKLEVSTRAAATAFAFQHQLV